MRVCLALNIPFLFFDLEEDYKRAVVDEVISEYRSGRTPNPDVLCNREIKFGVFWKKAKALGAHFIATGHYARVFKDSSGAFHLLEGVDKEKDQSYFLWTLGRDDLSRILFPIGHLNKGEVRQLARKYNLPVANKKDSQGICFLGSIEMEDFLSQYIEAKPGKVLDVNGGEIGWHKGAPYYTIGERHGFEVVKKDSSSGPFYIVAKDVERNTLTVSDKKDEIVRFSPKRISLKNINWINKPGEVVARVRYRGDRLPIKADGLEVEFKEPVRGLSLGQSIVFYQGEECLGGAIMDKIIS